MLSREEYIRLSLEFNLFWLRIMKEHAIFIESTIPAAVRQIAVEADRFKQQFERLLELCIRLANGWVSEDALRSGQYYTRYTDEAERNMQQFTGISINRELTLQETNIEPFTGSSEATARLEQQVSNLNESILNLMNAFLEFKAGLLNSQSGCRLYTFTYTAVLDHILREGEEYVQKLSTIQRGERPPAEIVNQDIYFWNTIMGDHAKTMRGLFDPTETEFFNEADRYAKMYEEILRISTESRAPADNTVEAVTGISEFKSETTAGLIGCDIKALMLPLFTDHLLREANHFKFMLSE